MTDRELLELAAKAAGIEIQPCTCSDPRWPFALKEGSGYGHWNPLIHDGDALRLAMSLGLQITPGKYKGDGATVTPVRHSTASVTSFRDDPAQQTREAIVRAAAEIGRLS